MHASVDYPGVNPRPIQVPAPPPQVVHVVARSGGFMRSVMFVFGLILFGVVFLIGLGVGVTMMLAGSSMEPVILRSHFRSGDRSTVAILPITGVIHGGTADLVRSAVESVIKDGNVRAIVLRVDSGGGGVTASDQVWYQVERLKKAGKPVVASFGSVAASGGYYVSCNADHILAEQTSITGSIGLIAQVLTMEGLMDKVGIEPVTLVASGSPQKDVANDIFRSWDDQDRDKILTMLDAAYETFSTRVQDGRGHVIDDPSRIARLADGSIYTSQQALENGLIDGIGYLDDAIAEAERQAGLTAGRSTVSVLRRPPSLFPAGLLMRGPSREGLAGLDAERLRALVNDLSAARIMYLMQ
jgi:protease-4